MKDDKWLQLTDMYIDPGLEDEDDKEIDLSYHEKKDIIYAKPVQSVFHIPNVSPYKVASHAEFDSKGLELYRIQQASGNVEQSFHTYHQLLRLQKNNFSLTMMESTLKLIFFRRI